MNKSKSWQHYSVQLAKAKINFYQPFERLTLRKIVEDILSITGSHRIDLFAIFDAVSKRGGFSQVQQRKRWTQIEYSLPYYKCNFKQIYQEHISKKQDEIKRYLKRFDKEYTTNQEIFIEVYFLTNSSAGGFYHFQDDENSFCKQNFTYVDQYLNIKSISTIPCPINKIAAQYADKYLLTRKWLIMKGYSRPFSEEELDRVQIMKIYNNNASVALIGWNLPNVLLAFKLHELKFNVAIYTNYDQQYDSKSLERMLSVKQGVFILDNGIGGPFSYSQLFAHHGIELSEVLNYCTLIDQNGRMIPQYRVRESQELFLSLLADFKFQDSNKKLLQNQIHNLLAKKRLNDEHNLMKWHLQRYLMLNNFHGQETTVNLHSNYLNRRKHKIFMQKKRPVYIKNCTNFVQKALKSFKVIQLKPRFIDFCNNIWIVEQRPNQKRSFSSLVYSDTQQLNDMISKRNFKVPSMQNQNFTILRQLSSNTWIHCSFKFKQKLRLKTDIVSQLTKKRKDFLKFCHYNISQGNCSFQFNGTYGFYYYYVIEEGMGLIVSCKVQKYMLESSTPDQLKKSLTIEILKQLQINILSYKLPELSQPQIIEYSHSFYLKDDSLNRDRIIKLKNWQRMYLLIGYPWSLNPNKLTSQIDCCNQILALIANVYYPLYKFDTTAKESFNNEYKKRKQQILLQDTQNLSLKKISQQISQNKLISQTSMKILNQQNLLPKAIQLQKIQQNMSIEIQKPNQDQIFQQPNQIKIKIQVSYNIIPSPQNIFSILKQSKDQQMNTQIFGFNNSFVKSSYDFVTQKVSSICKDIQQKLNIMSDESQSTQFQFFRQKSSEFYEILSGFQRSFQLQQPFKLSKNHYLHSLGKVRLQNISIKNIIQKVKKMQQQIRFAKDSGQIIDEKKFSLTIDLFLFDGYMTKMQFYSLDDPNKTAIYVQTLILIEQKKSMQNQNVINKNFIPLYVIFDETNLAIFYYHSSIQKLNQMFNAYIQQRKKQIPQRKYPLFRRKQNSKNLTKDTNKIQLMFQQIKLKIQDQIDCQFQKSDFFTHDDILDKILSDKLKSNVPQDFNQNQQENVMFNKVLYPQNNEQKTQFLMNALKKMTETQLKSYQIQSEVTLMDIFFGYLSSQMFVFEMFWNRKIQLFSKSATTYLETFEQMLQNIKKDDPTLYNEIENIRKQKQENEYTDYPLNIDFNENSLNVSRKFLASKNDPIEIIQEKVQDGEMEIEESQKKKSKKIQRSSYVVRKNQLLKNYIFIKEFSFKQAQLLDKKGDRQRVHCFLLIGEDDRKLGKFIVTYTELDPRQDPLQLIVSILVDTWDYQEIYDHFRNLLLSQIHNCEFKLSKKMSLYYQSTRKKPHLLSFSEVPQLTQTLNYKKPKPKGNKYLSTYQTQYYNDQNDKQTLLENLSNQNIIFSEGQIIFCKY